MKWNEIKQNKIFMPYDLVILLQGVSSRKNSERCKQRPMYKYIHQHIVYNNKNWKYFKCLFEDVLPQNASSLY